MEQILQLSPGQALLLMAMQIWMYVIFPIIVIRKLNYMTEVVEAQYYRDEGVTPDEDR